jgi:hypothetical protein
MVHYEEFMKLRKTDRERVVFLACISVSRIKSCYNCMHYLCWHTDGLSGKQATRVCQLFVVVSALMRVRPYVGYFNVLSQALTAVLNAEQRNSGYNRAVTIDPMQISKSTVNIWKRIWSIIYSEKHWIQARSGVKCQRLYHARRRGINLVHIK